MTSLLANDPGVTLNHPLDLVEELIAFNDWPYERSGDEEITASIKGSWCDYQFRCFWRDDDNVMQIATMLDMRIAEDKRASVFEALSLINERIWMGHFELWAEDGALIFRHASYVDSAAGMSLNHAQALVQAAVGECEKFYPVFQFILWAGKSPAEALEAALLETVGEA